MKKQSIVLVIDPWQPQSFLNKLFYIISDQRRLYKAVKNLLELKKEEIRSLVIAAYDNIPAMKAYKYLPVEKIYSTKYNDIVSMIENNNIKKIYICGMAWDSCVRNRELGYVNLYKLVRNLGVEIYVKNDCVICSSDYSFETFNQDNPINKDWKITREPDIYIYKPL